jgi:hypothetical protein
MEQGTEMSEPILRAMEKLHSTMTVMKEALEAADECLALIEDVGHGAHMDNVTVARGIVLRALESANA